MSRQTWTEFSFMMMGNYDTFSSLISVNYLFELVIELGVQIMWTLIDAQQYQKAIERCDKRLNKILNSGFFQTSSTEISQSRISFIWDMKGHCLCLLERYSEAISCYEKSLEIRAESIFTTVSIGVVKTKQGFYAENIAEYENSLNLEPNEPNLGQKYYSAALSDYEYASRINSRSTTLLIYKGFTYYRIGDYETAVENYNEALKIHPGDGLAWYYQGLSLNQLHRYEEAIKSFDEAIQFNYKIWEVWVNKGKAIKELGHDFSHFQLNTIPMIWLLIKNIHSWAGIIYLRKEQLEARYQAQIACLEEGKRYLESVSKNHSEDYAMLDYEIGQSYFCKGQDLYSLVFLV